VNYWVIFNYFIVTWWVIELRGFNGCVNLKFIGVVV